MKTHPTSPRPCRVVFFLALSATAFVHSVLIVECASAQHEDDYLKTLRSDLNLRKVGRWNHLPAYYGIEGGSWSASGVRKFLSQCEIKTPEQVCALVRKRYSAVAGRQLHAYEIVRATGFYTGGNAIERVRGKISYVWCATVTRLDGTTRHPRVTNRIWVGPNNGAMLAMLPAESTEKQADPSFPSEVYTGDLLPVVAQRLSNDDPQYLTRKLMGSKVPTGEHVKKLLHSKGEDAVPAPGVLGIATMFQLGCSIKDFGEDGDLVWVVQHHNFGLIRELWVNSRTQQIRSINLRNE